MILARRCPDRTAFAAFLFPASVDDLKRRFPALLLTPEIVEKAIATWDIVEFFDTEKNVIIGAATREPNHAIHLYVDPGRRASWEPHTSLRTMLDIFLSDCDSLYAAIPLTNRIALRIARKMGFLPTGTADGVAFHILTSQTRRPLDKNRRRRNSVTSE